MSRRRTGGKSPTGKPFSKVYMQNTDKFTKDKDTGLIVSEDTMYRKEQEEKDRYKREQHNEIENYNISVAKLDKRYSKDINLLSNAVLIRLYKIPYLNEVGLIQHMPFTIPPPDKGRKARTMSDPFPYQTIGVVVNMDEKIVEHTPFKVGDTVQIKHGLVETRIMENGNIGIANMFKRYDDKTFNGYVAMSPRDVICVLPKFKYKANKIEDND